MGKLLDEENFRHVSYHKTDVRKTIARERARLKAAAEQAARIKAEEAARAAPVLQIAARRKPA